MTVVTNHMRTGCYLVVDTHPVGFVLAGTGKTVLVNACARAFDQWAEANMGKPPRGWFIRNVRSDPEVKKFIPAWILIVLAGWVIQKILDYLWDNYTADPRPGPSAEST